MNDLDDIESVSVITPLAVQLYSNDVLFGETGCKVYGMLFNIFLVGYPLFMILNAVERFIAIVYPLRLNSITPGTKECANLVTSYKIL